MYLPKNGNKVNATKIDRQLKSHVVRNLFGPNMHTNVHNEGGENIILTELFKKLSITSKLYNTAPRQIFGLNLGLTSGTQGGGGTILVTPLFQRDEARDRAKLFPLKDIFLVLF